MLNTDKIRSDFKLLNGKNVPVYFDSACMSLKPNCVVDAMNEYYYEFPACTNRSPHKLGQKATKKVKEARKDIAKFIIADSEKEIIFINPPNKAPASAKPDNSWLGWLSGTWNWLKSKF